MWTLVGLSYMAVELCFSYVDQGLGLAIWLWSYFSYEDLRLGLAIWLWSYVLAMLTCDCPSLYGCGVVLPMWTWGWA